MGGKRRNGGGKEQIGTERGVDGMRKGEGGEGRRGHTTAIIS